MKSIQTKGLALLAQLLWLTPALTQPESESPYSDQAYDPVDHPEWYETPFFWIGLVVFGAALIYVLVKGRRA